MRLLVVFGGQVDPDRMTSAVFGTFIGAAAAAQSIKGEKQKN
jgi:hypothetical protein